MCTQFAEKSNMQYLIGTTPSLRAVSAYASASALNRKVFDFYALRTSVHYVNIQKLFSMLDRNDILVKENK